VQLLAELGQIVITLVVSGVVAFLVGPAYAAIAMLVMAMCLVLLYQTAKEINSIAKAHVRFGELCQIVGTATVFGAIWPAIPVILALRRASVNDGGSADA
jgi:hypothetical protein